MGAYYQAALADEESGEYVKYSTWDFDNGAKLMEHSYLGNNYCIAIENLLREPHKVIWLCDYTEGPICWDTTIEGTIESPSVIPPRFIINISKKLYYDRKKLPALYDSTADDGWHINPLPILTNSKDHSAGGGDYHPDDSRRGTWAGDTIMAADNMQETAIANINEYTDVTEDVLFYE